MFSYVFTNVLLLVHSHIVERGGFAIESRLAIMRARVRTPFTTNSKFGHFCSLHDAAWLECFPEKPSWCWIEQVCQRVKCKARTGHCAV